MPQTVDASFFGVALDAKGDLFLTDIANGCIWEAVAINGRITSSSQMIKVATGLQQPIGVAVDAAGDVFFTDTREGTVSEIVAVNGQASTTSEVVTIVSGMNGPYGLALDARGNLFVSDSLWGTVTEIPLATPPSLSFLTPTVAGKTDETDGHLTATIANSGNAPMNFTLPKSGMNPAVSTNFVWDSSSTCEQNTASTSTALPLAPGSSCTLAVLFKPAASGTIQGQLVINDNSLNAAAPGYASQIVSLTGVGERASQTIVFRAVSAGLHAHSAVELVAAATSHLAVKFESKTAKVCTVSGSRVSLLIAGTCTIEAIQPGNDEFLAAAIVSQTFKVALDRQVISFPAISTKEEVAETATLKASATSGLSVDFTSKTPKVCKVTRAKAELLTAGACTIEAEQAGNATFAAAKPIMRTLIVAAH